tara:strand:+ start:1278 stop:1520 length:243 start_codon:yes stop_codon:yes gene_type:complete
MPSKNKPAGDPKRIAMIKKGLNTKPKNGQPNPYAQHRRPGEKKITRREFEKKVAFGQLTHDVPAIAAEDKKVEEKEVFNK